MKNSAEKKSLHPDVTFVSGLKVNGLTNPGKLAKFPKKKKEESTLDYLLKYQPDNKKTIRETLKKDSRKLYRDYKKQLANKSA